MIERVTDVFELLEFGTLFWQNAGDDHIFFAISLGTWTNAAGDQFLDFVYWRKFYDNPIEMCILTRSVTDLHDDGIFKKNDFQRSILT